MRISSLVLILHLFAGLVCFAQEHNHKLPVWDDAYFDQHDRRIMDSLRDKMREGQGKLYPSLTEEQKEDALQEYIKAYSRRSQMQRDLVEIRNKPMTFFARVVDQKGQPVENAILTVSVTQEKMVGKRFLLKKTLTHRHAAKTDKSGEGVIKDVVGWRLNLEGIEANGYLFDPDQQPSLYFFPVRHPSNLKAKYFFRENKKFPVVFVLTKDQ